MKVNDTIRVAHLGNDIVWRVSGIYLAGLGGQDVIGLVNHLPLRNKPTAHGIIIDEMFVPREILNGFADISLSSDCQDS